ncbi:MAG TPA: penicillin-binding protein activator LpoB [Victivallales bacterium]|nr:penicillin-binding protein activator LpoB [Victivallales bacterium]HPO89984.1 penicillin-binding protein activator LpoB [Victivallales bacterium]HRR06566.1 penicillin-binding protein activator LpoB [Victivallales bacterium]HRR29027.1 penicillin-binding protein activator LpoB [Victivallales bacterium]
MKKTFYYFFSGIIALAIFASGCGTDPARIDASGTDTITTTDDVNVKDWQIAAEKCVNSLLTSGVLLRNDGRKSVIMVSTVKNSTNQHIDIQILTQKIRTAILRSGQALTTTAVSADGPEDKATKQVRDLQDDEMFNQNTVQKMGTVIAPDYSLAGEITQQSTRQGRMRESYFYFHLTLTDLKTGLAVWEDEVEIAKQAKKPLVGF